MKKHLILSAIAFGVLLVAASCNREFLSDNQPEPEAAEIGTVMFVSREDVAIEAESKSTLSSNKVYWESGDQIAIRSSKAPYNSYTLTLAAESIGKATGKFTTTDVIPAADYPFAVVYPADILSDRPMDLLGEASTPCFYIDLPYTQVYRSGSPAQNVILSCGYISSASELDAVSMKNLGGLLKLTIKGSGNVKEIGLVSEGTQDYMSGDSLAVAYEFSKNPSLVNGRGIMIVNTISGNTGTELTLDCSNGGSGVALTEAGVDFYFFVPAGNLNCTFEVFVETMDGFLMDKRAGAHAENTIALSKITAMPAFTFTKMYPRTPGVYNIAGGNIVKIAAAEGGLSQHGCDQISDTQNNYRLINWSTGYEVNMKTPTTLAEGNNYTMEVSTSGACPSGITSGTKTVNCKFSNNFYGRWLVDATNNIGYLVIE